MPDLLHFKITNQTTVKQEIVACRKFSQISQNSADSRNFPVAKLPKDQSRSSAIDELLLLSQNSRNCLWANIPKFSCREILNE